MVESLADVVVVSPIPLVLRVSLLLPEHEKYNVATSIIVATVFTGFIAECINTHEGFSL